MAIISQIEKRRAYRALDSKPIAKDILLRLAEAAHLAPSCGNSQSWRIVTVTDPGKLEALKATLASGNYWAKKAPAIVAFSTNLDWDGRLEGGRDYALFDLGMAAMNYQLQAVAEGLVAHPIAGFDTKTAKLALGIPEDVVLTTLVVLGYPGSKSELSDKHLAAESAPRERKNLEDVAAFDEWKAAFVPPKKA